MVSEDVSGLRQRVDDLTEQVRLLTAKVEELTTQIGGQSAHPLPAHLAAPAEDRRAPVISAGLQPPKAPTFLSTIAAVSFLLVIALILRTAADSGVINQQIGAFVGLVYAFALFVLDHVRYSRARRTVPVYSACGGLLIFAIVLENYVLFEATFTSLAYCILAASLVSMVGLGVRHRVPSLVGLGTLGVSVTGVALGFPEPIFPLLAALLLLANASVCVGGRLPQCRWMAWGMLALTMFFWMMWALKLSTALGREPEPAGIFAMWWFLSALGVFVLYYLGLSVRASLRKDGPLGHFASALPVLTVVWAYPAARSVIVRQGPVDWVGAVGVAVALVFLALALWLARREGPGKREATSFTLAALILWGVALHAVVSDMSTVIVLWSIIGLIAAVLSWKWQSGVLRATSYGYQVYAFSTAILAGGLLLLQPLTLSRVGLPLAMCGVCLAQYIWCRRRLPRAHGILFTSIDSQDRSAVVLLLIAIACAFEAIRAPWYEASNTSGAGGAFQCGQSVLIDAAAIALAAVGLLKRDGELLVVAALLAVIGAAKVFAFDFFHIRGLPLVLSVFFFGVTAALGALIWKHWQRSTI